MYRFQPRKDARQTKTNSKSHRRSKLSRTCLFLGESSCIFTTKTLYSTNTYSIGLSMDIQWVLILCINFKPFVSNVLTRLKNFKNFFGYCEKNAYNDCNILSIFATKFILLETKTIRFVWCAVKCTPRT